MKQATRNRSRNLIEFFIPMSRKDRKKAKWVLVPLFGSLLYGILYFIATLLYPGGSQFNKQSKGFSWMHNYWCNLLNEPAINGQHNPARPVALTAMAVLCMALTIFWYMFPAYVKFHKNIRLLLQFSGIAAMATGLFLFTAQHDAVINGATFFGMVALTGTFIGLNRLRWTKLFRMGLFIVPLIIVNNVLYYGNGLIYYLPVVQKITFLYFLLWVCSINVHLYKEIS